MRETSSKSSVTWSLSKATYRNDIQTTSNKRRTDATDATDAFGELLLTSDLTSAFCFKVFNFTKLCTKLHQIHSCLLRCSVLRIFLRSQHQFFSVTAANKRLTRQWLTRDIFTFSTFPACSMIHGIARRYLGHHSAITSTSQDHLHSGWRYLKIKLKACEIWKILSWSTLVNIGQHWSTLLSVDHDQKMNQKWKSRNRCKEGVITVKNCAFTHITHITHGRCGAQKAQAVNPFASGSRPAILGTSTCRALASCFWKISLVCFLNFSWYSWEMMEIDGSCVFLPNLPTSEKSRQALTTSQWMLTRLPRTLATSCARDASSTVASVAPIASDLRTKPVLKPRETIGCSRIWVLCVESLLKVLLQKKHRTPNMGLGTMTTPTTSNHIQPPKTALGRKWLRCNRCNRCKPWQPTALRLLRSNCEPFHAHRWLQRRQQAPPLQTKSQASVQRHRAKHKLLHETQKNIMNIMNSNKDK